MNWPETNAFQVTDGKLIQNVPSQQLLEQRVNGLRIMTGVCLNHYTCA